VLAQQKMERIIIIIVIIVIIIIIIVIITTTTNIAVTWKGAGLMTVLGHKSGVRKEYVLLRALYVAWGKTIVSESLNAAG
jgi:hypothetical protein